jgi:non-ribosomal peptide synthetase-like protein
VNDFLHQFFERAVQRWPDHIAVDMPASAWRARSAVTYAELDRWSNALSQRLAPTVNAECIVAILLPRGAAVYAAQLAVLKSGAAYTCIDPSFPDERARWILEDAGAVALITDAAGADRARAAGWATPLVDAGSIPVAGERTLSAQPAWLTPSSLAYLIYTSGTTGQPKGVAIEHRSIANLVASDLVEFGLTPDDRVGQSSSTSYDSSIEELWLAFAAGATAVVIDNETARMGPDVIPWLRRERVTVFCPPPTLLRATGCTDPSSELPDLRLLYVGGEALPRDVVDLWAPGRRLSNGYGPTECSVTAIRGDIRAGDAVSIGRPVPGMIAVVLNDAGGEAVSGERGELCLGGAGLARGYWRRPDLTAERFIAHPQFGRLYRTGDLAHRDADGVLFCHGRLDSQVKIRGYRIELDEIDAQLQACDGVLEAATAMHTPGTRATLVAFIVPDDPTEPPDPETLRAALSAVLPSYMVPSRFGFLSALPRTVGGKLDRAALPILAAVSESTPSVHVAPEGDIEIAIHDAVRRVLGRDDAVSAHGDFFTDLGGDSLAAALLVTRLRDEPATSWVAVRDIYDARTVAALAGRAPAARTLRNHPHAPHEPNEPHATEPHEPNAPHEPNERRVRFISTLLQSAWLLAGHLAASAVVYLVAFRLLPWLTHRLTLSRALLLMPALALAVVILYAPFALLFAVTMKRMLIGRYRPLVAPVWGGFYVRHWIVVSSARLIPWRTLQGTVFQSVALRALGAKVGRRVHIHRGVDLAHGGWDLLTLGDDVSIGQDAVIGVIELDGGQVVAGPVTIGDGAVLDVRAGVAGSTVVGAGAHLGALSSLPSGGVIPAGERWDGVPARRVGVALAAPSVPDDAALPPAVHGLVTIAAESVIALLKWLPVTTLAFLTARYYGIDAQELWQWMGAAVTSWSPVVNVMTLLVVSVPLTLAIDAIVMRAIGRVSPGVISRWSLAYVRVWLKTGLLQSAGNWLSGTLFWPVWLRAAGMTIGPRSEVSTIIDVVPELLTLGADVFLADGIYLGGPRVIGGTVTLETTSLGARTFLGNHVVIPSGQRLPDDILLGVCTVADDTVVRSGTAWFGHPPFELPRREVVDVDRRLTHEPSAIRYWNRVFWEALRITLPVAPALLLIAWFRVVIAADVAVSGFWMIAAVVPLATMATLAALCGLVLTLKWALLGRVRPGQHPLWSCWCSRWDFLYVAWNLYASPALAALEGTLWLPWYLRAMGMTIGKGVVLGAGFAQVVDPDMIEIEDGATVHAIFQAHTFEDRVLKIDSVRIRKRATLANGTVVLYGADIGEGTHVAPHSVVMKHERLAPGRRYEGAPTSLAR